MSGSIFDILKYEHRDLNQVDETSPLYQPKTSGRRVHFGHPPQELAFSDNGLTSDDEKGYSGSSYGFPYQGASEMDRLLSLSVEEATSAQSDQLDQFSQLLEWVTEDTNVLPPEFNQTANSSINNTETLKDDFEEEQIEEEEAVHDDTPAPIIQEEIVTEDIIDDTEETVFEPPPVAKAQPSPKIKVPVTEVPKKRRVTISKKSTHNKQQTE